MDLPNAKELKRLADACRKAGIRQFKGGGIEFTLTDDAPPESPYKQRKAAAAAKVNHDDGSNVIEDDSLSPEDLLFYSVGGSPIDATDKVDS